MQEPLYTNKAVLDSLLPLLKDDVPEVRRAAVLAVGLADDAITIQEMLPLLQDPDQGVRDLCVKALQGRRMPDTHIELAKKITDHHPGTRLEVVNLLQEAEDLDPTVWLQHLSEDVSPAVRAAAIRCAAADPASTDFRERVLQMSRDDPSPTVRQLALHYLKALQGNK
jgi:HEAT repeat protein